MQRSLYKKQQNNNRIIEQCVTHARWRILTCASHLSRNRRFTFNCSQQRFSLSMYVYIYEDISRGAQTNGIHAKNINCRPAHEFHVLVLINCLTYILLFLCRLSAVAVCAFCILPH